MNTNVFTIYLDPTLDYRLVAPVVDLSHFHFLTIMEWSLPAQERLESYKYMKL